MGAENRLVRVREHGWIRRAEVGEIRWRRLQRADRQVEREEGSSVFDWSRTDAAKAGSLVGVLAVEGLTVEILPKVDEVDGADGSDCAQQNLLFMLRRAGWLPFREAGTAALEQEVGSLLDVFARLFAGRLLAEWRRGPDRAYLRREENLRYLRGRLVLPQHLRQNAIQKDRFFVEHDVLEEDTALGRLLKAAIRLLLGTCRDRSTLHLLGMLMEEMSFVSDVGIAEARTIHAPLGRLNERYRPLRDFAKLVLGAMSPSPRAATETSFSILFPMEQVFEGYVAETLRMWAPRLGIERSRVRVQGRGDRRFLLRSVATGKGRTQLKPDVWIASGGEGRGIVLDTKWKLPEKSRSIGPSPADVYQMLAYAQAYDPRDLLLVYPRYQMSGERDWYFPGGRHRLRVVEWPVEAPLAERESLLFDEIRAWVEGE